MAKGFFSQAVAILFEQPPSLDDLARAVAPREIVNRLDGGHHWAAGGPSIVVSFRPEANGYFAIDSVPKVWPDGMGDPKEETELFGAWSMGHFGPYAYPNGLARATQQAWHWQAAAEAVSRHNAFVRIRCSYVFGAKSDAPVLPSDYDPMAEFLAAAELGDAVLSAEGAICYFNSSGECLYPRSAVSELLARHKGTGPPAQELWANVRIFQLPADPTWSVMDSVGMWQLDAPDHEACFSTAAYDPSDISLFLRNAADYVREKGPVIKDGDTMDGPGDLRWQGATFENGLADPPREVIRWLPLDDIPRPAGIQGE